MPDHLAAYVQKKLITPWKRNTLKHLTENRPTFLYSSNDSWQFGPYARTGAVLWVIASHPPDPPALVAKLDNIRQVCVDIDRSAIPDRVYRRFAHRLYVVLGGSGSRFFGHNDVSDVLLKLTYLNRFDSPWRLYEGKSKHPKWRPRYGTRLIRPARIAGGARGAAELQKYADRLSSRTVFLSYKRRDHWSKVEQDRIQQFVRELIDRNFAVWLDRIALPATRGRKKRKREYSQKEQDSMLTALLRHGLDDSKVLLAVSSARYGVPSRSGKRNWTRDEWMAVSESAGRDEPCVPAVWALYPQSSPDAEVDLSEEEPFSRSKSAKRAAQDFDSWFRDAKGASPPQGSRIVPTTAPSTIA